MDLFSCEIINDIMVVSFNTTIINYAIVNEVKEYFSFIIEKLENPKLILNLQDVKFIDSLGIGALVTVYYRGQKKFEEKLKFILVNVNPIVETALSSIKMDTLFDFSKNVDAALKSLNSNN